MRLPERAVHEDEPRAAHLGPLSDHRLHPGLHGQLPCGERLAGREDPEGADGAAYPEDQPHVDAIGRGFVLEEEHKAEAQRDEAACGQHAVRRRMQVDDQQGYAEQDQRKTSPARSEHREPVQASTKETAPSAPGSTIPGWSTSKMSPTIPSRNSRLIRFGSMIVLRKRVKKPGLTVTISAPARCSVYGR